MAMCTLYTFLTRAEANLSNELRHSYVERETLVVLLGNGVRGAADGIEKLRRVRTKQLTDDLGLDRTPMLNSGLVKITEDPLAI
jgi:hypothetical protein